MVWLDKRYYSASERIAHGLAAFCVVYLMVSGLALHAPIFYGLAALCGGPAVLAWLHPLMGLLYFGTILFLFSAWASAMILGRTDRRWLSDMRRYIYGQVWELPTTDRFHAGQKILFWIQVGAALVLFLSGMVLWFPLSFPVALRGLSLFLHEASFFLTAGALIIHIYVRLFMPRGALHGLLRGMRRSRSTRRSNPSTSYKPRD